MEDKLHGLLDEIKQPEQEPLDEIQKKEGPPGSKEDSSRREAG